MESIKEKLQSRSDKIQRLMTNVKRVEDAIRNADVVGEGFVSSDTVTAGSLPKDHELVQTTMGVELTEDSVLSPVMSSAADNGEGINPVSSGQSGENRGESTKKNKKKTKKVRIHDVSTLPGGADVKINGLERDQSEHETHLKLVKKGRAKKTKVGKSYALSMFKTEFSPSDDAKDAFKKTLKEILLRSESRYISLDIQINVPTQQLTDVISDLRTAPRMELNNIPLRLYVLGDVETPVVSRINVFDVGFTWRLPADLRAVMELQGVGVKVEVQHRFLVPKKNGLPDYVIWYTGGYEYCFSLTKTKMALSFGKNVGIDHPLHRKLCTALNEELAIRKMELQVKRGVGPFSAALDRLLRNNQDTN